MLPSSGCRQEDGQEFTRRGRSCSVPVTVGVSPRLCEVTARCDSSPCIVQRSGLSTALCKGIEFLLQGKPRSFCWLLGCRQSAHVGPCSAPQAKSHSIVAPHPQPGPTCGPSPYNVRLPPQRRPLLHAPPPPNHPTISATVPTPHHGLDIQCRNACAPPSLHGSL